ncbi:MAG: hypothetical protein ACOYL1_06720 [Chlamydiia bacterium]
MTNATNSYTQANRLFDLMNKTAKYNNIDLQFPQLNSASSKFSIESKDPSTVAKKIENLKKIITILNSELQNKLSTEQKASFVEITDAASDSAQDTSSKMQIILRNFMIQYLKFEKLSASTENPRHEQPTLTVKDEASTNNVMRANPATGTIFKLPNLRPALLLLAPAFLGAGLGLMKAYRSNPELFQKLPQCLSNLAPKPVPLGLVIDLE